MPAHEQHAVLPIRLGVRIRARTSQIVLLYIVALLEQTCMYLLPHMPCMYPLPHMPCMYPPPCMALLFSKHSGALTFENLSHACILLLSCMYPPPPHMTVSCMYPPPHMTGLHVQRICVCARGPTRVHHTAVYRYKNTFYR